MANDFPHRDEIYGRQQLILDNGQILDWKKGVSVKIYI
jgi:hypothetical protein